MNILVTYYTRTGNTGLLAKELAGSLKADLDHIVDKKSRKGVLGLLAAGKDAFWKKSTEISFAKDPKEYDIVVVGTPVWAGIAAPGVRAYLQKNDFKKVAFFCTFRRQAGKTFKDMEKICKRPLAVLGLKAKRLDDKERIEEFCRKIKGSS
ncbi:MAG: flavodoxin [Nanoarchaeota archaeon]|nr:flavodoxin [Nanoarchaeota archaeon]